MLTLSPSVQVYIATQPIDMRKSFDGLATATRQVLGHDPLSGYLFVFFNRTRTLTKILFWDRSGYCLFCKRLERGTFHIPEAAPGATQLEVEAVDLSLLHEGIDLRGATRRPRWTPGAVSAPVLSV